MFQSKGYCHIDSGFLFLPLKGPYVRNESGAKAEKMGGRLNKLQTPLKKKTLQQLVHNGNVGM